MIKFTQSRNTITPSIDRIQRDLTELGPGAYKTWVENTPVRSGRARRSTRLRNGGTTRAVIDANYPYAVPLDKGSSRKAPNGMSRPTLSWLVKALNRIMRK